MNDFFIVWVKKRKMFLSIGTIVIFFLVIILLTFSLFFKEETADQTNESLTDYYMNQASTFQSDAASQETNNKVSGKEEKKSEEFIFVDVKGAVRMPGVYEINSETRLTDVITLAGGFLPTADQSVVNLSQKLTDQMMITIPELGVKLKQESIDVQEAVEDFPVITIPNETINAETQTEIGKVNLNTTDSVGLQTLSGIGEKKAERILQYRQEHGSFKSIEELKEVSGIGDKTFEALAEFISVGKE